MKFKTYRKVSKKLESELITLIKDKKLTWRNVNFTVKGKAYNKAGYNYEDGVAYQHQNDADYLPNEYELSDFGINFDDLFQDIYGDTVYTAVKWCEVKYNIDQDGNYCFQCHELSI
jgi:hypothetical protein